MKWNASALAALFLLTACGGGGGFSDYGPVESAGSQGSPAAQSYGGGDRIAAQRDSGVERIDADLDPQQAVPQRAGASYARPDSGYQPPVQQQYRPEPQQQYQPQQDGYADPTANAQGPRGTSGNGPRSDAVGYAGTRGVQGEGTDGAVVAVHPSLPAGTIVEVTNLENGRTILVLVTGAMDGADHLIDLSPGAARQLGASSPQTPVRVRRVSASAQDRTALESGQPAADRPDTPPCCSMRSVRRFPPRSPSVPPRATYAPARRLARPRSAPRRCAARPRQGDISTCRSPRSRTPPTRRAWRRACTASSSRAAGSTASRWGRSEPRARPKQHVQMPRGAAMVMREFSLRIDSHHQTDRTHP